MDRSIILPGQIPLDGDLLRGEQFAMVAQGYSDQATFGTATCFEGLGVTPTSPASLNILVAPGSVYAQMPLESTNFGSLPANTSELIVKQGIHHATDTFTLTPPGTIGYSINYLVQVSYSNLDTDSVVRPYYNASNPQQAYAGPNNSGTADFTTRKGVCNLSIKPGAAAPTGTQLNPTPDAGWVGVAIVAVPYGATTITSGNIYTYNLDIDTFAPNIPAKLPAISRWLHYFLAYCGITPAGSNVNQFTRAIRSQKLQQIVAGGTANALTASLSPSPASYTELNGAMFMLIPAVNNTGAATINLNTLGVINIVRTDGTAIQKNDLRAGQMTPASINGSTLQILGFVPSLAKVRLIANLAITINSATGNDNNTGGVSDPFQTLQAATNYVYKNFDLNGFSVTFNAVGTFTAGVSLGGLFQGQSTTSQVVYSLGTAPITATNSSCFLVDAGKITVLNGGQMSANGSGSGQGSCFNVSGAGEIQFATVNLGNCTQAQMQASNGGRLTAIGHYQCSALSALYHMATLTGGTISISGWILTMTAILTCNTFATALGGSIYAAGTTFTGAGIAGCVGIKFGADLFGTIFVNGAGVNYFPGNGAGTATAKGDYR